MSLLASRCHDDQTHQIQQLIHRFFGEFMQPAEAHQAAKAFESRYPLTQMQTWSHQASDSPLWHSLLLAIQCGQLLQQQPRIKLGQVFSSHQMGVDLQHDFAKLSQEQLVVFCLDTKNQIVRRQVVFQGTLNACPVHPRELFQVALQTTTARIVIAHNHPSGDAAPSKKDVAFTKRLQACGELLGIPLLDSFIAGENDYFSFAEQGLLNCNIES